MNWRRYGRRRDPARGDDAQVPQSGDDIAEMLG